MVADQERVQVFVQSLQDWGYVFMFAVWAQSVMISAIAKKAEKETGSREDGLKKRDELMMKESMATIWDEFKTEFPGCVTTKEERDADMIILIRDQVAHCLISSGIGFALYAPRKPENPNRLSQSQKRLGRLEGAGRVRIPADAAPEKKLILREGNAEWFTNNRAMIEGFFENTILRLTRAHGINDWEVC